MLQPIYDPDHWRERAEQSRVWASQTTDPDFRDAMLKLAADYDQLVVRAERRITRSKQPPEFASPK